MNARKASISKHCARHHAQAVGEMHINDFYIAYVLVSFSLTNRSTPQSCDLKVIGKF